MASDTQINLVVYADLPHLMNNNILNREFMSQFHGGEALTDMAEAILATGFEFMTIDRYLSTCQHRRALLVSNMAEGLKINNKNIIHSVCYSLESPIIATRYYHHLQDKTKAFDFVYDWEGVRPRIENNQSRFMPISWPNKVSVQLVTEQWKNKKFLVMISSKKRALQCTWPELSLRGLISFPRALVSNIRTTCIKYVDPFMASELYLERLQIVEYFSKFESFDLYGGLWSNDQNDLEDNIKNAISKCYRGIIKDKGKLEYLKRYKFSIVFENTIFPGYITEKIFDCFFSKVIPIYLGDPYVTHRIPISCFIDARNFNSYSELNQYLLSITETEAAKYINAAQEFINSKAFEAFTSKHFAKNIVNCLKKSKYYKG